MRKQSWVIIGSVFAGVTVLVLLLALSFLWGRLTSYETASAPPRPVTTPNVSQNSTQLKGEVVRKEPNFYVIRDASGREFRLRVNQRTSVEQEPKIGDHVVARVDPRPAEVYAKTLDVRAEGSRNDTVQKKPAGLEVIEGVVVRAEGESFVVKDISGHEVRLHIDGHTKKDGNVTVGDRVIASTDAATEPGYTVSLMKH
jgi:translation initiation factor IF-1